MLLSKPIPARAGVGLRAPHYETVLETRPEHLWFEVHSENYFGRGGKPLYYLEEIAALYPISFHGVGLSLGSSDSFDPAHLLKLRTMIERFHPHFVSEHLSWSSIGGHFLNDLLPLPYTEESLQWVSAKLDHLQNYLKREILIENISSYVTFAHDPLSEPEFLTALAHKTGCGILLDVNNLYVNSINHGWDPKAYLQALPQAFIKEIHLAGFTSKIGEDEQLLIDTHSRAVADPVWQLYEYTVQYLGSLPTLIEWDQEIPAFDVLLQEAKKADKILKSVHA